MCCFVSIEYFPVDKSCAGSSDVYLHELWPAEFPAGCRSHEPTQQDPTENEVTC